MNTNDKVISANKLKDKVQSLYLYVSGRIVGKKLLSELLDTYKDGILQSIDEAPPVDAIVITDEKLLRAVKLLMEQYEHSKNSEYVNYPVAHAFYHTWKKVDTNG